MSRVKLLLVLILFASTIGRCQTQRESIEGVFENKGEDRYFIVKFYLSGIFESRLTSNKLNLESKGIYTKMGDTLLLNSNNRLTDSLTKEHLSEKWLISTKNSIRRSDGSFLNRNKQREKQYQNGPLNRNPLEIRTRDGRGPVDPLIIIDKEVVDNEAMNKLNPNQIRSIEVIQDQNAVSLYGEKAKGGVIIIYTKKSKQ